MRSALAACIVCLAIGVVLWGPADATAVQPEASLAVGSSSTVMHRVVWNTTDQGIQLYSADVDGTDIRKIYTRPRGQITDLTLNRQGTEVALAPLVLHAARMPLVVADVLGHRTSQDLLAGDDHHIYYVGGIGWSPNGRKLVFEGAVAPRPHDLRDYLWTIHRDGSHLHRLTLLNRITANSPGPLINAVAWTPDGIFYDNLHGLERYQRGRTTLVLSHVINLTISGDGNWFYVQRNRDGGSDLWRLHPDGTEVQEIIHDLYPHPGTGDIWSSAPNYDGSQLLSVTDSPDPNQGYQLVVHDATRAPSPTDQVLPITHVDVATWN